MNLANECELIISKSTKLESRDKENIKNNDKIYFIIGGRIINNQ